MAKTRKMSDTTLTPEIRFKSFNPYLGLPHVPKKTRVISRDTLDVIKYLRSEGYKVIVEPEDGSKVCYTVEKGFTEFISNPVNAFCVGIPVSIITNIISTWLTDKKKRMPESAKIPEKSSIVIEINESGTRIRYDSCGQPLSDEQFDRIMELVKVAPKEWAATRSVIAPSSDTPFPVFIEHTPKIVGWCNLSLNDNGILASPIKIIDEETRIRVKLGDYRGFSFGGIIHESQCSLCGKEYFECNHVSGQTYPEGECVTNIKGVYFAELSIVKEPIQPLSLINKSSLETNLEPSILEKYKVNSEEKNQLNLASTISIGR